MQTIAWDRVISERLRFGLAERDTITTLGGSPASASHQEQEQEQALTMHRLTQQVVCCRLAEANLDGPMLVAVLNKACPAAPEDPATWRRFAALTSNIQRLAAFREEPWLNRRNYSWLVERLGVYLRRGPAGFAASRQYLEQAVAMDRADLGEEDPDTLTSMHNLANTLLAQGDFSGARALHERVLEDRRRVLGEEDLDTLIAMNNLANTLRKQGDLSGARALHERVLEVRRRVLGEEQLQTLESMNNLANTLRAQGDLIGARALQERVLEVRRRVLGEGHPDTLSAASNLSLILEALHAG
ncbi:MULTISPECIES: tetratricopeptide repeat protein [unclassified Synechococcus]|uniref:tetratricopeptide repeat protein n=1 Tax=unclassified Synechococcus TaxID=2626047 RepID=UPI0000699710|nr:MULTISPECIES: tetratricopeptide repeat protein [unclassified Synechococcus]EAQ75274.1 putative ATP/GTP binding protein [Synechococcus sp. WH 5701]WFN57856.1 tetratricopeptide repeat protein [Synechococcus sp. CCFWC 502]